MLKGHHLHPTLFCNFKSFNIKAAMAHHPIIQKEVNELLARGATEPLTGDADFYPNVFIVPKHTGGLWCILYLR